MDSKNIEIVRGLLYNPHSQGSVERLYQTLKKSLFANYNEYLSDNNKKGNFDIKNSILNICKNYNSMKHSATHYPSIKIFFSDNKELFNNVIEDLKLKYKNNNKDNGFNIYEKVLLNPKIIKTNIKNDGNNIPFLNL